MPGLSVTGAGNITATLDGGEITYAGPANGGSATTTPSNISADDGSVTSLSFASSSDGWAILSGSKCPSMNKSQDKLSGKHVYCSQFSALYSTTDGGATWNSLS